MTRARQPTAAERLYRICEDGLCIGCGLCQSVAGPDRIRVVKTTTGYERPVVVGPLDHATVDTIYDVCPGTRLEGLPEQLVGSETHIDPAWGPYRRIVRAYAADDEVRFRGATGGVLTALAQYLVQSSRVAFVLHVSASKTNPTFGERTISVDAGQVLAGAGSRYGPTAPLIDVRDALDRNEPFAFVGKPCDIAALRNYARHDERVDALVHYWLTPVCGGFMPPDGMNDFLSRFGATTDDVVSFSYRGNGCPGPTRFELRDGRVISMRYTDFWGEDESKWTLPFRCKMCPDGIGEAADIAAADTWPGGSPDPTTEDQDPGTNAIIARTEMGVALIADAERDGALVIERDIGPRDMDTYQPHQVTKKYAVWARHAGLRAAGRLTPQTERLRIAELARAQGVAENLHQARGTRRRAQEGKTSEPTPIPAKDIE